MLTQDNPGARLCTFGGVRASICEVELYSEGSGSLSAYAVQPRINGRLCKEQSFFMV